MNYNNLPMEIKVGQMLVAGFDGTEINSHIETLIKEYHIGNVILFARNFKSIEQLYKLNMDLQRLALKENGIPLFITTDQEGGMVMRITEGGAYFPGNMALSAGGKTEDAYVQGKYCGQELKALGINMNLAPVLDVNNNPKNPVIGVRSYGEDPSRVASFGEAYVKGLQESDVIATGKHFPGHGDTSVDSHLDLSAVKHDIKRIEEVELLPFKKAIEGGIAAIMSAHVIFSAFEKENLPATLSYKVLTELLRKKLGFNGLIMTDCMEMKAIATYFGTEKAAEMSVSAGADMVCVCHTLEKQINSYKNILKSVYDGKISIERINESFERIISFKEKFNIKSFVNSNYEEAEKIITDSKHKKFAKNISENSITLLKNENMLPLKHNEKILFVSSSPVALTGADDTIKKKQIGEYVKTIFPEFTYENINIKPSKDEIERYKAEVKNYEKIVLCTYNANLYEEQVSLAKEIFNNNKNLIIIAMRNPYDANELSFAKAIALTYEYTPLSIHSVGELLNGKIQGKGVCPVTLNL